MLSNRVRFDRDLASELILDQGRWSWGQRLGRLGSGRNRADIGIGKTRWYRRWDQKWSLLGKFCRRSVVAG